MIREVKNETELLTHLVKFLSAKNIRDLKIGYILMERVLMRIRKL